MQKTGRKQTKQLSGKSSQSSLQTFAHLENNLMVKSTVDKTRKEIVHQDKVWAFLVYISKHRHPGFKQGLNDSGISALQF